MTYDIVYRPDGLMVLDHVEDPDRPWDRWSPGPRQMSLFLNDITPVPSVGSEPGQQLGGQSLSVARRHVALDMLQPPHAGDHGRH